MVRECESLWPFEMTMLPLRCMYCRRGNEMDKTLNWASVCGEHEQPLTGWLHRGCERKFLKQMAG